MRTDSLGSPAPIFWLDELESQLNLIVKETTIVYT